MKDPAVVIAGGSSGIGAAVASGTMMPGLLLLLTLASCASTPNANATATATATATSPRTAASTSTPIATSTPAPIAVPAAKPNPAPLLPRGQIALLVAFQLRDGGEYNVVLDGKYYMAYFDQADGPGYAANKGTKVPVADGTSGTFDTVRVRPSDRSRPTLTKTLHLARFDVNGGLGAAANAYVVVSAPVVLDGSKEYPIVPSAALATAMKDVSAELDSQRALLEKLVTDALPESDRARERQVHPDMLTILPSWQSKEEELVIDIRMPMTGTVTRSRVENIPCGHCPPGAPCVACGPVHRQDTLYATAELAFAYRFDKRGKLLNRNVSQPHLTRRP